ncbi:toll-like receptor 6 [Lineus longissimus]|uniref:toll-like receptor 6 n=1 Tax=Lineus longissimus TaxID=88925 RepID=UPI00315D329A
MSKGCAYLSIAIWSLNFVLSSMGGALQDGIRGSQEDALDRQAGSHDSDYDQQDIVSVLPKGCSMIDNHTVTCITADASTIPEFINGLSRGLDRFSFKFAMGGAIDLKHATFPPKSSLTSLEISTSNLEGIHTSTLQHLTMLKYLNLKNNHIKTLEPDIFKSSRSTLEILDLSNNDIKILDQNIFSALEVLEHLDLSNNRLQSFDAPFTSPAMNSVLLAGNPLQTGQVSWKSETYTCDLDFSFTEISVLKDSMFSNIVCTASDKFQLSLKGDHITKVDTGLFKGFSKEFGKLDASGIKWQLTNRSSLEDFMLALAGQSIDYLDFSSSYLTQEEVKYFLLLQTTKHLGTLDISDNIIGSTSKSWPIYINFLPISTMRVLNISANGNNKGLVFDTLLPVLEVLDLSHNIIPIYQDSVVFSTGDTGNTSVPALRVLKMTAAFQTSSGDMIRPPSKQNITWFEGLGKLEELYLNNNYKLYEASPDFHLATMFRGLHNLRNLSLASTSFGRRGFRDDELENLFGDLENTLIYLDLRDNHISHRSLVILKGLKKLKVLDLRSNDIGYLVGEWYTPNLEQLYITDNSLLVISYSTMGEALKNSLQFMSIADNPYSCSCELAGFTAWLKTNANANLTHGKVHVPDLYYAKCMIPEHMEETMIIEYQPDAFSCNQLGIIILGAFATVIFLFLVALVIYLISKSTDIQFYFRTRKGHRVASGGVFMGYCQGHQGENFRDNIEQAWVHKCIPDRVEFNPDLPVHVKFMQPVKESDDTTLLGRQIVDQHEQLRFILLVMGPLFIQHYSNDVITTVCANGDVMRKCKEKFVLVLINGLKKTSLPVGMAPLKRCATCYEWPDSKRARNIFWKRLLMKLSKKSPSCC